MMEAESSVRDQAVARLKRKREFRSHVFVFVLVNVALWLIWAFSGDDRGFPWPAFVTVFWGLGVAMQAWGIYGQRPISEQEIDEEVRRIQSGG
jgi:2TM domain